MANTHFPENFLPLTKLSQKPDNATRTFVAKKRILIGRESCLMQKKIMKASC